MDFIENFKSRLQSYYKVRQTINSREQKLEKIEVSRRQTRGRMLSELRNIDEICESPIEEKPKNETKKKLDRFTKLKLWKAEKEKKILQQKAIIKPLFKVGARANVGFPALTIGTKVNHQSTKSSFAPSNHIFKPPKNIKPIDIKSNNQTKKKPFVLKHYAFQGSTNIKPNEVNDTNKNMPINPFQRITRSQKPVMSPPTLTLPTRRKKANIDVVASSKTNKIPKKLVRQNAVTEEPKIIKNSVPTTPFKKLDKKTPLKSQIKINENKENILIHSESEAIDLMKKTPNRRKSLRSNKSNHENVTENILAENLPKMIAGVSPENIKQKATRKSLRNCISNSSEELVVTNNIMESVDSNGSSKKNSTIVVQFPQSISSRESTSKLPKSEPNEKNSSNSLKKITASRRKSLRNTVPTKVIDTIDLTELDNTTPYKNAKEKSSKSRRSSRRKSNRITTIDFEKNTQIEDSVFLPETSKNMNTTPENSHVLPAYISPFVTTSRGKGSMKKENLERSIRGLPSFSEYNTPDKNANSSFQEAGVVYFYTVLNNEISRLTSLCTTWNDYKEKTENLTEDSIDLIDVAVGQANLLMNKKFEQFRNLIVSCENGYGQEKPVTCKDLQGFWDMIYIQVENLNSRFKRLTEMKNNNWVEILPVVPKKVMKKGPAKKYVKSNSTSSIRAAIKAARKKFTSVEENQENVFNGGFFVVKSPQKTPTEKSSSTRKSLLKSVLKTQTKKHMTESPNSTGVAMITASQLAKSYENLNSSLLSPGKSILKNRIQPKRRKSERSTSKVVLFQDFSSDE